MVTGREKCCTFLESSLELARRKKTNQASYLNAVTRQFGKLCKLRNTRIIPCTQPTSKFQ